MGKKKDGSEQNPAGADDINTIINRLFNEMMEGHEVPVAPGTVVRFDINVSDKGITITPNTNTGVQVQSMKVEDREPLVDIIDRKEGIVVIAELPGVEKKQIELHADHERLSIKADSGKGIFSRLVELPSKVDPLSAGAVYNNGVLEVSFKRSNTYRSIAKIDVK